VKILFFDKKNVRKIDTLEHQTLLEVKFRNIIRSWNTTTKKSWYTGFGLAL